MVASKHAVRAGANARSLCIAFGVHLCDVTGRIESGDLTHHLVTHTYARALTPSIGLWFRCVLCSYPTDGQTLAELQRGLLRVLQLFFVACLRADIGVTGISLFTRARRRWSKNMVCLCFGGTHAVCRRLLQLRKHISRAHLCTRSQQSAPLSFSAYSLLIH